MKYIIEGGKKVQGNITLSGNKNSIFPCVAASLLTKEEVVLENISDISDSQILIKILEQIGVKVKKKGSTLNINAKEIQKNTLPEELVSKLRGSIVLVGALLARMGKVSFYHPGGDIIGQRSINTHLEGFKKLGAKLDDNDLRFSIEYQSFDKINDCEIFLEEASVTACENLILASTLGKRRVTLKNCPKEPHIQDLCKMINIMGGKIFGAGSDTIIIEGVSKLSGIKFKIGIDYIEMGTYIIAAAVTNGEIKIDGLDETDIDPILVPLKRFGVVIERDGNTLQVKKSDLYSVHRITTNIWPGFPTDLMSAVIVLATQSRGQTLCHDWMYEGRMFFVDKLISMGAQITLADPHRVIVYGPSQLIGRNLESPDIRAGMALVIAALIAKGTSIIGQAELIERGYENVEKKLKSVGANIKKIE